MKVADITYDSVVDGEGIRTVIFFQGCSINCKGCHNPESQDKRKGWACNPKMLINKLLANNWNNKITLSGGEPLEQNLEHLLEFIKLFKQICADNNKRPNIWIYSGKHYIYKDFANNKLIYNILKECNVLVDGPFILSKKKELPFRGSTNQRLIDLSKTFKNKKIINYKLK